ncbi:MAG: hypothetical protein LBC61_01745 [Candidatus Peribacteria bacterium]|nr:hypothetical protein [Candidatus Peribacteria bacterium]
MRRILLSSIP